VTTDRSPDASASSRDTRPDAGLLLLRVGAGTMLLLLHGGPRLAHAIGLTFLGEPWTFVGLVDRMGFPLPAVFAVASAVSESVAVGLVMAGAFTRSASALVAVNFAVAASSEALKGDPFELPAMYLVWALVVLVTGPGAFSLDGWRARRRRPSSI
jgi:putative oxidoreductase